MAFGMIHAGVRQVAIGKRFNMSESVDCQLLSSYNEIGNVEERVRTGRPSVTTRQ